MSLIRPITFTPDVKSSTSHDVVATLIEMKDRVCGYIIKKGFNPPDEIFQEVAEAVLRNKTTVNNPEAYIFSVTRNCIQKAFREKYNRVDKASTTTEEDLLNCEAYITEQNHREREQRNWKELLRAQTLGIIDNCLPKKQKQVMKRYLLGMSYEKIAAELEITKVSARQYKCRAVREIRRIMSESNHTINSTKSILK